MYQLQGGEIIFEEVMIALCLFIGCEPQSSPKNLILVQKVQFLEFDHFDLLDFSPKILIISYRHIFITKYIKMLYSHHFRNFWPTVYYQKNVAHLSYLYILVIGLYKSER